MFVPWKLDFLSLMKTHIPEHHCWFWIPVTTREQHARLISHNHLHIEAVGKYRSVSSVHTLFLLFWGRYCPSHVAVCISMWLNLTIHELMSQPANRGEWLSLSRGVYCLQTQNKQTNEVVRHLLSRLQRTWFSLKALGFYVHMIVCVFILFGFRPLPLSYR